MPLLEPVTTATLGAGVAMTPLDVCDNQVDPVGEELDLVEVSHEDFGDVVVVCFEIYFRKVIRETSMSNSA